MKPMFRFVASAVAVALVAAGLPTAISQAAQGTGDERKAFLAARAAAETGDAIAQFNLAVMWDNGKGTLENDTEALQWYRQAAAQDLAVAHFFVGIVYAEGRGVPQDDAEALIWFRNAAELGLASTQFKLGYMYSSGQGVTENLTEAYFWLSLAARNGESGAEGTRSVIERRMTRDQITEAQRRSAAWKPKSSQ